MVLRKKPYKGIWKINKFLSLCDTWKQQPVDKDMLTDLDIRKRGFGLGK